MNQDQFKRLFLIIFFPLLIFGFYLADKLPFLESKIYYCDFEAIECRFAPKSTYISEEYRAEFAEHLYETSTVLENFPIQNLLFKWDENSLNDIEKKEIIEYIVDGALTKCHFFQNYTFHCYIPHLFDKKFVSGDFSFNNPKDKESFSNLIKNELKDTGEDYRLTVKVITAFMILLPLLLFLLFSFLIKYITTGSTKDIKYLKFLTLFTLTIIISVTILMFFGINFKTDETITLL